MKIIIIILQAILNLVRKRRDLIANRNKIPPEYRDDVVVWVAATKEYPDLFGGVTIGNGKIKIGVPGIDKDIVLEAADIDHLKSCLK